VKTVHLHIQSQTEKLSLVRDFVGAAAQQFGFDEESTGKIMLAVDEACTNIIKHSYEYVPNKDIDLEIRTNGKKFEIVITHRGKSFDPNAIKSPNMREYLSHFQRGGLGMHLMRSLMDKVEYKTFPDSINRVHLIKYLPVSVGK
jgi:serine/threonine-protein kinase RsbW